MALISEGKEHLHVGGKDRVLYNQWIITWEKNRPWRINKALLISVHTWENVKKKLKGRRTSLTILKDGLSGKDDSETTRVQVFQMIMLCR